MARKKAGERPAPKEKRKKRTPKSTGERPSVPKNLKKKKLTIKQQKLLTEISENLGKKGSTKTMYQMMLDAGFAENTAHQQASILGPLEEKPEAKDIVKMMQEKRAQAIDAITEVKLIKACARDLAYVTSTFTGTIELLSGRPTGREELVLPDKDKKEIDNIFDDNNK